MIQIITIFILNCLIITCHAQPSFERVMNSSCECMQTQKWGNNPSVMQAQADSCVEIALIYNLSALEKELNLDINDGRAGQLFGEKLGKALYQNCRAYQLYWEQLTELELQELLASKEKQTGRLETIKTDMQGRRLYLCIRSKTDSLISFAWEEQFGNDTVFIRDWRQWRGREISVYYEYKNLFNHWNNSYEQLAVILKVEISPKDNQMDNFINPQDEKKRRAEAKAEHKQKIRIAEQQLKAMRKQKIE